MTLSDGHGRSAHLGWQVIQGHAGYPDPRRGLPVDGRSVIDWESPLTRLAVSSEEERRPLPVPAENIIKGWESRKK